MQQTHLELKPYQDSFYNDWLDLAAHFSISFEENHCIWNDRPSLNSGDVSYLLLKNEDLIASIDLKKTSRGYDCVHWAMNAAKGITLLVFLKEVATKIKLPIYINVAHEKMASQLVKAGAELVEEKVSFFLVGSAYESLLRTDAFCDHYLCIANNEKFKTILNSETLVRREFMKPIKHNLIKFNLL